MRLPCAILRSLNANSTSRDRARVYRLRAGCWNREEAARTANGHPGSRNTHTSGVQTANSAPYYPKPRQQQQQQLNPPHRPLRPIASTTNHAASQRVHHYVTAAPGGGAEKRPYRAAIQAPIKQPPRKKVCSLNAVKSDCVLSVSEYDKVESSAESYISVAPGELLCGRYRVLGVKGQGTFGTVLDTIDTKYNRNIALKVIRSERRYLDAAYREVEILRRISELDPKRECRCVRLYNAFEMTHKGKRHIGIVFERLGRDLHRFIRDNRYRGFHMVHVQHFAAQLLHGVRFCHHHSLIHTDIKPENILFERSDYRYEKNWNGGLSDYKVPVSSKQDTADRLWLSDMEAQSSLARRYDEVVSTTPHVAYVHTSFSFVHNAVDVDDPPAALMTLFPLMNATIAVGTPSRQYRAPEVILNVGWSFPADIWSVGCILAELRTGRLLFDTHETIPPPQDLEHLALMEKILDEKMPLEMGKQHLKLNRPPSSSTTTQSGMMQGSRER
eukprot:jgi/Bigna1/76903/fgenesh1_pg.44_\